MIRKSLYLVLAFFFLISLINCDKEKTTQDVLKKEEIKEEITSPEHELSSRNSYVHLTEETQKMIGIKTVKVKYHPLKSYLTAMGKVLAPQTRTAIVSYAFPARISKINIKIGDWVKANQELVTLQSEEVGEAKSKFYKAIADYELAKINYEREEKLFKRDVGAKKNLLSTEAEYKIAQANLNASEKKLHVLGFNEEQVKILAETHQINPTISLYAPINGKIIINNAVLGAMIDQSTEILRIMDPSILWVDAEIYEKDISKIKIGQEIEISVPAYLGETFSGKISYIGDVLKEETRTITVRAEVVNRKYKLKPGMFADIKILLNNQSKALVLPDEAILDDKDKKIVFIKKGDAYICQKVEIGAGEKGLIEILKGVREGDEVVIRGNFQLKSKLYEDVLKKAATR